MKKRLAAVLVRDQNGNSLLEYSLLTGIISAAILIGVAGVAGWIAGRWGGFSALLP